VCRPSPTWWSSRQAPRQLDRSKHTPPGRSCEYPQTSWTHVPGGVSTATPALSRARQVDAAPPVTRGTPPSTPPGARSRRVRSPVICWSSREGRSVGSLVEQGGPPGPSVVETTAAEAGTRPGAAGVSTTLAGARCSTTGGTAGRAERAARPERRRDHRSGGWDRARGRRGLDDARWRSLLDHRCSRWSSREGRQARTSSGPPQRRLSPGPRSAGSRRRSLALAARPPVVSLVEQRGPPGPNVVETTAAQAGTRPGAAGVSTTLAGARCSTTGGRAGRAVEADPSDCWSSREGRQARTSSRPPQRRLGPGPGSAGSRRRSLALAARPTRGLSEHAETVAGNNRSAFPVGLP